MATLSRKIAQFLSLFVFFTLLIVGIVSDESFSLSHFPIIGLKAFTGYVIFWLFGLIISDIVLKAIVTSVEDKDLDKWEGGMLDNFSKDKNEELQRVQARK
ncbi:MAG: hypothetical protein A2268_03985 [Candidatus Raymondbacteria bacterium RifOxyA12_full_50_37]|uniref:Uncharacterized protein n=1 Tax=Candidatus Raymondbacteria bacterium RIFOXYD12_FULL_49_13 TaxID=1817890 RepID=A0A1F7FAN8_UNCRA|nr:MAG: hypothetical protein A2268_03985 [Candidatus Raymondbacteria bacterium RifOxyA12_full_50_37]OGJ92615.1 MAG: hypothetical protein A2248_05965 [Candidatus Raymondbacteria bacterium RIFOXYA2_FULL_49_16]OGJ97969.1 MAG: hypothetical protein A2453_02990 [Candidatus Raymondbacteria bacterium RIFOXYC2_FULL_50_21]OGJ98623.1 MAG: hypothetical protein A2487_05605 [Candidatus Raymondbacteria bacterium RifOxyC12_full_50_8]OGK01984.1 MAG: hypothetical protein A2350_21090 [Candidatus Raymondbacteria b